MWNQGHWVWTGLVTDDVQLVNVWVCMCVCVCCMCMVLEACKVLSACAGVLVPAACVRAS